MMNRRAISIPLTLLWALAHGMWIGAGWHASSEGPAHADFSLKSAPRFSCCCPNERTSTRPVMQQAQSAAQCPVCALAAVSPNLSLAIAVELPPPVFFIEQVSEISSPHDTISIELPPQRGPPSLA